MIDLRDIVYSYPRGRRALDGASLRVSKGDRLALLGPNGAGKTTLMHTIVGLLKPDSGVVRIFGQLRKTEQDFAEVRGRIGLLFQDPDDQLFCPTVEEDVAFGPLNLGKSRQEARGIVRQTLERLGLQGFERRLTHALSGGEQRLVSLATVIAMAPQALLLDEPVAGLDEATTERIARFLTENDLTYVTVSHDRGFLRRVTARAVRLKDGKIEEASLDAGG